MAATRSPMARVSAVVVSGGISTVTLIWLVSLSGIKTVPIRVAPMPLTTSSATTPQRTAARWERALSSSRAYQFTNRSKSRCLVWSGLRSSLEERAGTSVRATIRLATRE